MSLDDDKPATSDDEILEEARKRYALCVDADSDNREKALSDLRFLSGEQWDEKDKTRRTIEGRPCLTINKLPTFLHQVTNAQRQNKPGIKVHAVDDDSDEETAEVVQGLIRHIEYASNASVAYDTAVNSAAAIGFGYFQITTDYCDVKSFDQDIKFKRIRNSLSVKIDPLSQELDGSDMKFAFIESQMSRSEFKSQYPKAEANNMTLFQNGQAYQSWLSNETVLICEYYRIERTTATIFLLEDGSTCYKDEAPKGITIKNTRESYKQKVMWYKITGVDILDKTEIKCDFIPVFPVYGDEIDIEGKVTRSGLIRYARDPAQMYNYWMTAATEEVAMRNKTPYIGAEGQFEGYENEWQDANVVSYSYLQYKPVTIDGNLAPAPQRQPMADVPTGVLAMAMHASDNIKATTGLFDPSLGAVKNASSGIQVQKQQQAGDVANFHYADNLNMTIRHVGRCIISMIPNYYDSERTVRILGEDDTATHQPINQPIPPEQQQPDEETGAIKKVLNDMTVGKYDITVAAGPSYDTMRQEAAEFFSSALSSAKDPTTSAILTYLAIQNQDVPGSEEAAAMLKKLIPPNILPPEDDKEQGQMVTTSQGPLTVEHAGQVIDQLQQQMQAAQPQLQKQAQENQQQEQELNSLRTELENQTQQLNYDKQLMQAKDAFTKQLVQAQEMAADAQQKATLTEAMAQIESIVAAYKDQVEEMVESVKVPATTEAAAEDVLATQKQAGMQEVLQQQHEQMMTQLSGIIQPLTQALSAPRKLVRDEQGRPTGSEIA